jgi:hypothetical protein
MSISGRTIGKVFVVWGTVSNGSFPFQLGTVLNRSRHYKRRTRSVAASESRPAPHLHALRYLHFRSEAYILSLILVGRFP